LATQAARFYLSHDPALARMRVLDVDVLVAGSWLVGIGMGALFASRLVHWTWAAIVVGAILSAWPMVRWFRARRARRPALSHTGSAGKSSDAST
jgi:hypothetical protein